MEKKIEDFDRNKPISLTDIIRTDNKIQIVDKLGNLIAVFFSPFHAAEYLMMHDERYIKLSFNNGRYDLFYLDIQLEGCNINLSVEPVPIENNSFKFPSS